jgi:hypothetical protein
VCLRHEHAIIQHVHVGPSSQDRSRHPLLALRENELRNSTFGIVVPPVILLIPFGVFNCIVGRGIDVVLYPLVSCDLVRSYAVEKFVLLSDSEAVRVHPGAPDAIKSPVQVLLTILAALNEGNVRQFGYVLGAFGVDVACEHAGGITAAVGESFQSP